MRRGGLHLQQISFQWKILIKRYLSHTPRDKRIWKFHTLCNLSFLSSEDTKQLPFERLNWKLLQWHRKTQMGTKHREKNVIVYIWVSMNWSEDPLSLIRSWHDYCCGLLKHCYCYLHSADTCPLRTGLRPARRVILTQIKLYMFKGLHKWTLLVIPHRIIPNLEHCHHHGVTTEQKDGREA